MVGWSSSSKERKGVLHAEEKEDLCFWILMAGITHLGPQAGGYTGAFFVRACKYAI